jgi:hypothetical protein
MSVYIRALEMTSGAVWYRWQGHAGSNTETFGFSSGLLPIRSVWVFSPLTLQPHDTIPWNHA